MPHTIFILLCFLGACSANAQFVTINESQYPTEIINKLELNPDLKIDSIAVWGTMETMEELLRHTQDTLIYYNIYYSLGNVKTELQVENRKGEIFLTSQNYLELACIRRPEQEQYRPLPSKERIATAVREQALKVRKIRYSPKQGYFRSHGTDNSGTFKDGLLSRKMSFYIDFLLTDRTNYVFTGRDMVHLDTLKKQKKENNYETYLLFGSGLFDPPGEIARGREILLDVYACNVRADAIISRIQHEIIEYNYDHSRKRNIFKRKKR